MKGDGLVKYAGYKDPENGYKKPGLRNHRRTHWAKIRMAKQMERELREDARLARDQRNPADYGYDEWYKHGPGRDERP